MEKTIDLVIEGLFLCLADEFNSIEYMLQQLYDDLATVRVDADYLKQLSVGNSVDIETQKHYISRCLKERANMSRAPIGARETLDLLDSAL